MNSALPALPAEATVRIHEFLRAHALSPGLDGGIVGLSGGIDSALVARLARDALGRERVLAVLLPDDATPGPLRSETVAYAEALGLRHRSIPIDRILAAFRERLPEVDDRVTLGNTKARIRMAVLYALAREERKVVLGTGNRSELLLGYFTKYGDGGVDLLPIGDLYKTHVRELARALALPEPILARAPSADLWDGQTDEEELGLPYEQIDPALDRLEHGGSPERIAAELDLPPARVASLQARIERNRHKRLLPPIARVFPRR